jgi:acyl dehydratase
LLDPEKILAGYVEWACGYLASAHPERTTWVARRQGKLVAFACCSRDSNGEDCEGVLYGVDPAHAGGGLYGDLIRFTQAEFRARGFRRMSVSTQVWNFAVQKVWAREGFFLCNAWDTYHVNSMLSAGERIVAREVRYTAEQIERFAAATGDSNPVHLDGAVARASGFDGCIAHGMLTAVELSRIFGTEVPGPGTLFTRCELAFVAPVYVDRPYRLEVRALSPAPWHGYVPAVTTLRGGDGKLCLLAYSDLLRRS